MNEKLSAPESKTPHLDGLRTALAINRGMELLWKLSAEEHATVELDASKRADYLNSLFLRIHNEMFHDWQPQASGKNRPGFIASAEDRRKVREIIRNLVSTNGDNDKAHSALFDTNGFATHQSNENLSELLSDFYYKMKRIKPFEFGNELALDLFMVALGKMPAFRAVFPSGIDFRRLDEFDSQVLHDSGSNLDELHSVFAHAMDNTRTPALHNPADGYPKWPSNEVYISGIPFLSHEKEGVKYLVTVNGGLIPLDDVRNNLEAEIISGRQIADYVPILLSPATEYLPGTEALRKPEVTHIDGFPVTPNSAPLFCLDVNTLTGLRSQDQAALEELIKNVTGKKPSSLDLLALVDKPDNAGMKEKLLKEAFDSRLKRSVEVAYEHLANVNEQLKPGQEEIFKGKKSDSHPKLFMSMGGAGSGKSSVKNIVQSQCGENFVTTSLDAFRDYSNLYKLLLAANHHGDDYRVTEPLILAMREIIANKAKNERFNLFYDGSGIVYKGRYDNLAKSFKQKDFTVQICAVDAPIANVIPRIQERYEDQKRALPWTVTIGKHTRAPASFLQATEDPSADKVSLFANDGGLGKDYLVAESFILSDEEIQKLKSLKNDGMAAYLKSLISTNENSTLRSLAEEGNVQALIDKIPDFEDSNTGYLVYPHIGNGKQVLVIYNTARFQKFMEKGGLNPQASSESCLSQLPDSMSFVHGLSLNKASTAKGI